jgi:hypothetical protein
MSDLETEQGIEFLHHLARHLQNHWVCAPCTALHPVDRTDLPDIPDFKLWRWKPCQMTEHRQLGQDYTIREMHVQPKLSQRCEKVNRKYLRDLLRPYSDTVVGYISKSLRRHYTAVPKIIDDIFLLQVGWDYVDNGKVIAYNELIGICICPHLDFCTGNRGGTMTPFEHLATRAFSDKMIGTELTAWCCHCTTATLCRLLSAMSGFALSMISEGKSPQPVQRGEIV